MTAVGGPSADTLEQRNTPRASDFVQLHTILLGLEIAMFVYLGFQFPHGTSGERDLRADIFIIVEPIVWFESHVRKTVLGG